MTLVPLVVSAPFHSWVMVWPLASVHLSVQPLMAELPAVTVIPAWKPPGQLFTGVYVAEQAPGGGGLLDLDGDELGGGELGGGELGGGLLDLGGDELGGGGGEPVAPAFIALSAPVKAGLGW